MKRSLQAIAMAAWLCLVPVTSGAGVITLDSVLRYAEVDLDTGTDPPAARIEGREPGVFHARVWVDNRPSLVAANVVADHNSDLQLSDNQLSLLGTFVADPYWYWHMQTEWYALGAEVVFSLSAPAEFILTTSQSCYYWFSDDHWCSTWYAQFSTSLDGRTDFGGTGLLGPGTHRFVVSSWDYDPWNGQQTMNFDFTVSALPVPEPATLLLVAAGLAGMFAARARSSRPAPPRRDAHAASSGTPP